MIALVAFVVVALGFSFLCSILEAVLLSVTPSYLARLDKEGHRAAPGLIELKQNLDRPLAAILGLNTIAHTVGAAGAGAQAQALWGSEVLAVASAVLTLLILVLSEIIPKTLGALHWQRLAPVTARIIPIIVWTLYPLVVLSESVTRLVGRGKEGPTALDREEIAAVTELAAERGLFGVSESRILRTLFRFRDLRVRDVMTPRTVVQAVPDVATVESVLANGRVMRFSRIPVWHSSQDDVIGYALKDDVLLAAARDELRRTVGTLARKVQIVPEGLPVTSAFEKLVDSREQLALAVDEFGGMAGIVTLEDIVETLLGLEIVDELDTTTDMRDLARRSWRARAKRLGLLPEPG